MIERKNRNYTHEHDIWNEITNFSLDKGKEVIKLMKVESQLTDKNFLRDRISPSAQ